jgi:hypothetical protein
MSLESIQQSLLASKANLDAALSELDLLINPPIPVVNVGASDNLTSLIANGSVGTIYRIPTMFRSGTVTVTKPCSIMSMRSSLDLPNTRIDPGTILPQIQGQLIVDAPNVNVVGIKVMGTVASNTLLMANQANLNLDRIVLQGSLNGQKRGIYATSPNLNVLKSWIGGCWYSDDSQAILSERGVNGLFVDDCYLEASGENVMFGGGDALSADGIPQNISFTNCHFRKPEEWRAQAGTGNKNLFELKMAKNVKVDNCLFENSWVDAQVGYGIVLTVRNQYGRDPWATIQDVEFTNCKLKSVAAGISILGRDYLQVSEGMKNVKFKNFTIEDLSAGYGGNGRTLQLQGGPENLVFEDFKVVSPGSVHSMIEFVQPKFPFSGLAFRNCEFYEGSYGIQHTGEGFPAGTTPPLRGAATLAYFNPNGYVWEGVTVHKGPNKWTYPLGTVMVP